MVSYYTRLVSQCRDVQILHTTPTVVQSDGFNAVADLGILKKGGAPPDTQMFSVY